MGMPMVLLLKTLCILLTALSVHGSAGSVVSPSSTPHHFGRKRHGRLVAPPLNRELPNLYPVPHSPTNVPAAHHAKGASNIAIPPSLPSSQVHGDKWTRGFAKLHHARTKFSSAAPEPSFVLPPRSYHEKGLRPSASPLLSPFSSPMGQGWPAASPSPTTQSSQYAMPIISPTISPLASSLHRTRTPPPSAILSLPPPPPNEDCTSVTCTEPLTYTASGSPCACVWPIQVRLRLSVELYTFFPLVSELAGEIAASFSLNRSQVRITGANAASQQLEKTIVLVDLVPLGAKFNATTAYLTYEKFWRRQVSIKPSLFGAYEVLYVHYPGLPPSPPFAPSSIASTDDGPHPAHDNDGRTFKPFGVAVPKRKRDSLSGGMIAIIALSSFTALVLCMGITWLLLLKCGVCAHKHEKIPHAFISSFGKPSGTARSVFGSRTSSATMSISSTMMAYTGSAKTFSLNEIERATDNFNASRILGEGGFGLVYSGILDDGTKVAVKVLKRDDQQGGREFMAEVEMLSRLHHRNLVKLIGICIEDHTRCLVYELISNGSVESHLHGVDKERDPLDWGARMKIALGAARGLAYLHEDSSPRVIHRDFKSSNILLEDDFIPKVSDFGLAKTALDEGNKHISTRVMGTFGYLAPEYAMTGHLLVKSDVYSYGVVLLELLTGRKPVDLSQPPGQENLVAWARPLLTSREGLETIIDPVLPSNIPFDTVAKVAAIASMCVQPEVSHRPFMGEVVQALKLVCNEFYETKELSGSRTCSQEDLSLEVDSKVTGISSELVEVSHTYHPMPGYDSSFGNRIALSTSDLVSASAAFEGQDLGSFRRHATSGPLKIGKRRQFWQRLKGLSRGSKSEREFTFDM